MKLQVLGLIIVLVSLGILTIVFFTDSDRYKPDKKEYKNIEKGINVVFFRNIEESDIEEVAKTLDRLKDIGVTHISVVLFIYQEGKTSTKIYEDSHQTLPKDQLVKYIRAAKEKGFTLQLLPLLGVSEGDDDSVGKWNISPADLSKWFASYDEEILKYAEIAEVEKVEVFGIGSEMSSLSGETGRWQNLIEKVRGVYKGQILYAANWDDFTEGTFRNELGWLKKVDIIGVDSYFPLKTGENPSVEELQSVWTKWEAIFARLRTSDKKIIVSEIGITSTTEHFDEPWRFDIDDKEVDLATQEKYYEAAFRFFQNKVDGIYWWVIDDGLPPQSPLQDKGFSPLGKPAEQVLRKWYSADYN